MNNTLNISRRGFLKGSAAMGGGLALGFNFDALAQGKAAGPVVVPEANAWVVVRPDNTIIIRYARAEMGQGSMTSAPMLVAEELEADWNRVKVEYARASEQVKRKRAWGDMAAVGSRTIRNSQEYLRKAGAGAREMLVSAAATRWGVPGHECVAANSVITHAKTGRTLTYGQVALAAAKIEPPKDPKIKDPKDFKLVGKSIRRVDIPDIVTGRIRYGIDAQVPGMLYAAVAACPVFGGKVKSVDASKITGRRGIVKVLPMGDFVAVVADNWWRANEALKVLPIEWDVGDNANVTSASIMDFFKAGLTQTDVAIAKKAGDTDKAFPTRRR